MNFEIYLASGLLLILVILKSLKSFMDIKLTKDHFNNIAFGIFLLALVQISQFLFNNDLFSTLPFISEPVGFRLFAWSLSLFSMIIILRSVAVWLPLSQKHIESKKLSFEKAELFKRIIQLIQVESRPVELFDKTIREIVKTYSLIDGKVILRSVTKGTSKDIAYYKNKKKIEESNFDDVNIFENVIPIEFDSVLLGCIIIKSDYSDSNIISNIKLIADLLGRHIKSEAYVKIYDSIKEDRRIKTELLNMIPDTNDLRKFLSLFFSKIKNHSHVDMITILYPISEKQYDKITLSVQGAYLHEKNVSLNLNQISDYVIQSRQTVIIDNIIEEFDFNVDPVIARADMKNQVTYPIRLSENLTAAVTFASTDSRLTGNTNLERLNGYLIYLDNYFLAYSMTLTESDKVNKDKTVNRFKSDISSLSSLDKICKRASENYLKNSNFDLVRISLFEKESDFLKSVALASKTDLSYITPEDASMFLPMMPFHQQVKEKGVIVNIDRDKSNLSESEMGQIAGQAFESMTLVPIIFQDHAIGVISFISFTDSVDNLTNKEFINGVNLKTNYLSMLMSHHSVLSEQGRSEKALNRIIDRVYVKDIDQVKSSLSGLIGSVEILKNIHSDHPDINRVVRVMDRSTQKISNCLNLNK